jgi:hypothetical protein
MWYFNVHRLVSNNKLYTTVGGFVSDIMAADGKMANLSYNVVNCM